MPAKRKQDNDVDAPVLKLDELSAAIGADRVEAVPSPPLDPAAQEVMKQRMAALIDGKIPPPNEFVKYLVDRLRTGNEEFRVVQQNIQELNNRLNQFQKRAIQLQGEQNKYAQDITAWWDRVALKADKDTIAAPAEGED